MFLSHMMGRKQSVPGTSISVSRKRRICLGVEDIYCVPLQRKVVYVCHLGQGSGSKGTLPATGQPGLHSKFQASQSYRMRLWSGKGKKTKRRVSEGLSPPSLQTSLFSEVDLLVPLCNCIRNKKPFCKNSLVIVLNRRLILYWGEWDHRSMRKYFISEICFTFFV